jgi:hypothetical protein
MAVRPGKEQGFEMHPSGNCVMLRSSPRIPMDRFDSSIELFPQRFSNPCSIRIIRARLSWTTLGAIFPLSCRLVSALKLFSLITYCIFCASMAEVDSGKQRAW